MRRILFLAFLGVAAALLLRVYVVEGIYIASASMEPTLSVGRHLFVNKLVYRFRPPRRGEMVVFSSPVEKKELVKRVIGVAGDDIRIEAKQVILNGSILVEPYGQHTRADEELVGDDLDVGRVPPGHVFLLGDNRDESGDSRDWLDAQGEDLFFIPLSLLKGKLVQLP